MKAVEDLAQALAEGDRGGIGNAVGHLGVLDHGRVVTSIDDPRSIDAPEPFRVRSGELIPVIADYERAIARPREESQSGKDVH
jgi:hypothetical protein